MSNTSDHHFFRTSFFGQKQIRSLYMVRRKYDETILKRSEKLAAEWLSSTPPTDAAGYLKCQPHQKINFLNRLLAAVRSLSYSHSSRKVKEKCLSVHVWFEEEGKMTLELVTKMDQLYNLTAVKNSEIRLLYPPPLPSSSESDRLRWCRLALHCHYEPIIQCALDFAAEQGRMKYTRPLYRSLKEWSVSAGKAVEQFKAVRETMHPMTANIVAKDLGVEED